MMGQKELFLEILLCPLQCPLSLSIALTLQIPQDGSEAGRRGTERCWAIPLCCLMPWRQKDITGNLLSVFLKLHQRARWWGDGW